jgi:acetoin utilization protein AcuC
MTDGKPVEFRDWSGGYDPGTALDRAVMATRSEVFPLHGLDPMP